MPQEVISQLGPMLRQHTRTAELERRLPAEVVQALRDAGLFRTWVPKAYGGLEMDPIPALTLFEELARINGSVGWVVSNSTFFSFMCQILPDDGSAEILAAPRTIVAGAANPPGSATPVEGGYRVTGRWPFGSGCHFADWLAAPCLIMDGGSPRLGPDGNPLLLFVFVKREEAEILDTWYALGMRGTGSADFRMTEVFVPERRSAPLAPIEHPGRAFTGPLYRLGPWLGITQIPMTALGIARAALDAFIDLAATKTPSFTQTALADRSSVQDAVARTRAQIDAARSYIHATVSDAWQFVQGGPRITVAEGVPLGLAASFGVRAAVQAVDLVHDAAGTTAIREEHPFQQYFRDVHTISQHAQASSARFESLGKLMLGRETDWALYYI